MMFCGSESGCLSSGLSSPREPGGHVGDFDRATLGLSGICNLSFLLQSPVRSQRSQLHTAPPMSLSRHDLYERCVQRPGELVPFLRALHGRFPLALAEDFCGSAALSREWLRIDSRARAHACDIDAEMIAAARERCPSPALSLAHADALDAPMSCSDVIFVGNFSIGFLHQRALLLRYLAHARARLAKGGIFVCDTYGGESAFRVGAIQRLIQLDAQSRVRYTWEHREANALTSMVTNAIHFRIERDGEVVEELTDAFVYRWRLWSVRELIDALHESGFAGMEIRDTLDATSTCAHVGENFAVTITARAG